VAKSIALILLSVAFGVVGQIALKTGMTQIGRIGGGQALAPLATALRVLGTPLVLIGLACYGLGAVAWLIVLSRLDLSFAYPFLALNFLLITLGSRFVLHEPVSLLRWLGVLVIAAGVIIVARS
jgi:drug/metabolite transporter (DMT)-like permease